MELPISRLLDISMAALAGAALGLVFVGGLWLTVRRAANLRLAIVAVSFLARSAILLVGLWWVGREDPARMLACGAAALATRSLVVRACAYSRPGTIIRDAHEGES